jgi:hypothetical protein
MLRFCLLVFGKKHLPEDQAALALALLLIRQVQLILQFHQVALQLKYNFGVVVVVVALLELVQEELVAAVPIILEQFTLRVVAL